jgi:hypothetical protein
MNEKQIARVRIPSPRFDGTELLLGDFSIQTLATSTACFLSGGSTISRKIDEKSELTTTKRRDLNFPAVPCDAALDSQLI